MRHRKVLGLDVPISILLLSWDISATLDGYLYNSIITYLHSNPIYFCSDNCEITVAPNVPIFLPMSASLRHFEKNPGNSTTFCHHLQTKYNQTSQNQVETM